MAGETEDQLAFNLAGTQIGASSVVSEPSVPYREKKNSFNHYTPTGSTTKSSHYQLKSQSLRKGTNVSSAMDGKENSM